MSIIIPRYGLLKKRKAYMVVDRSGCAKDPLSSIFCHSVCLVGKCKYSMDCEVIGIGSVANKNCSNQCGVADGN